jgi:hypothetical protein
VYVLNNNENLKMSKYIPKVGETFEYCHNLSGDWVKCGEVKAVTKLQIAFIESDGLFSFISRDNDFRPIPTKADVEREILIDIVIKHRVLAEGRVQLIQQAGFTIPKKIKRSDLSNQLKPYALISDGAKYDILNDICDFLGDLVEQDEGGDV